jgi:LytR cell envelope-related transcriptional attenuator
MVFLAFSLQEQVEKYGAYVGIAAFFGLAVLSLLYFAQAREVRRLREWAGRMPERAEDLERGYYAEEPRPAPQPVAQPRPVVQAQPVSVAPANGTVELKPEEVAALAFARAAGVHEPHLPKPHTAPVPVAAAATVAAPAPSQTVAVPPPEPTSTNGGGAGHAAPPPPATPAARRVEPLPPRRPKQPAARRAPASPPPRREGGPRALIITGIAAVLVLVAVFLGFQQLGGDDPERTAGNSGGNQIQPDQTPEGDATAEPTAEPGVSKEEAQVAVLNGTSSTGLARTNADLLVTDGYPDDNVKTGDLGEDEQATTSTVMYARGDKDAAEGVAEVLGIERVAQLDEAKLAAAVRVGDREWNVVVVIGQDKSTG